MVTRPSKVSFRPKSHCYLSLSHSSAPHPVSIAVSTDLLRPRSKRSAHANKWGPVASKIAPSCVSSIVLFPYCWSPRGSRCKGIFYIVLLCASYTSIPGEASLRLRLLMRGIVWVEDVSEADCLLRGGGWAPSFTLPRGLQVSVRYAIVGLRGESNVISSVCWFDSPASLPDAWQQILFMICADKHWAEFLRSDRKSWTFDLKIILHFWTNGASCGCWARSNVPGGLLAGSAL